MVDLTSHNDCFNALIEYRNSASLIIKIIELQHGKGQHLLSILYIY